VKPATAIKDIMAIHRSKTKQIFVQWKQCIAKHEPTHLSAKLTWNG